MVITFLASVLTLAPFLYVLGSKNRGLTFGVVSLLIISFHLITSILTQTLGLFSYEIILGLYIVLLAIFFIKKSILHVLRNINLRSISITLIFVVILSVLYLYSVHYDYSGQYTVLNKVEYQTADNLKYEYPYYSDEWYSVSFINQTIETKLPPSANPLDENASFLNLELPFHSFLSQVFLFFGLDPLNHYTLVTIFFGTLSILLIYLILRGSGLGQVSSGVASLLTLFIVNGSNLPGLWNLIPINTGLLCMLITLLFLTHRKINYALPSCFISLIFYPPLVVFLLPMLITYILVNKVSKTELVNLTILIVLAAFVVYMAYFLVESDLVSNSSLFYTLYFMGLLAYILKNSKRKSISRISFIYFYAIVPILLIGLVVIVGFGYGSGLLVDFGDLLNNRLLYPIFTSGAHPDYAIYNVIPLVVLLFGALGLIRICKLNKWILSGLLVGMIYWFVYYNGIDKRLIIEYQRVILATSYIIIITAGYGLGYLINKLKGYRRFDYRYTSSIVGGIAALIFILLLPGYTERDNWQNLVLTAKESGNTYLPAAPATVFLHEDDLRIFSNFKKETFLSIPWKGTVIGVATDNYPLSTKDGTITINPTLAKSFYESDCATKRYITNLYDINYIYLPPFNCGDYEQIDESEEGFVLYRVKGI